MISFLYFLNSIRAHVRHRVFETLQIKLYCAVEYDSKWSTKIHEDCMLDVFVISLLRRLLIFKKNNSIRAHVEHTAFATLQIVVDYDNKWVINLMKIVCWIFFNFTFKTSLCKFFKFSN